MTPQVLIVGGGRIVHDRLLPALYRLQRESRIGEIGVCASTHETVCRLAEDSALHSEFPAQSFRMWPAVGFEGRHPSLYRQAIGSLPPHQLVVVAVPDHLHFDVALEAVECDQHVCCVKPLAMEYRRGAEIAEKGRLHGLLVAVDYHQRFHPDNLTARTTYREGRFGEFRLASAYCRASYPRWMTPSHSDAFTYFGCQYVDLVAFITGLLPIAVSTYGILDRTSDGTDAYLWTDARVIWENGACLTVQNGPGVSESAVQGLTLYCQGADDTGVSIEPVTGGHDGYRSMEAVVLAVGRVNGEGPAVLDEIDRAAILATASNSSYNDRVIEAARESILDNGREVPISYLEEVA